MQKTIARHLGALKKAIRSLENYYRHELPLINNVFDDSRPQGPFPHITSFMPKSDTATQEFTYETQLDEGKLVFIGKLRTGKRICIKFTQQYSDVVHNYCASKGFAPALHGVNRLAGGWYMVVMDAVDIDHEEITAKRCSAIDEIRSGLVMLHQAGYVHGDIRDANVMVPKDGSTGFMLVDFDWAGKIGVVRYPALVNRKDILRPEGAEDGKLILANHDMYMIEKLLANSM
jgi:hypothetical protein